MPPVSAKSIPWYRRRWLKLTAVIVGIVIVVAGLIAGFLYAAWQARPEKALLDAANYAMITPATYTVTTADTNVTVGAKDQRYKIDGTIKSIPISAIYSENTLYIKSPKPEKLYDMYFAGTVPGLFESTVKSMVTNLKDRWISIDIYKMQSNQGDIGTARCGIRTIGQFADDSAPRLQIGAMYATNPFLDIKTQEASSIQTTYQLGINQANFKAFYSNLTKLDGFRSSQDCLAVTNRLVGGNLAGMTVDLSISRPDHHLRSATIYDQSNTPVKIQADYNKIPEITVPTDVTTYDQIAGSLIKSILPSFLGGQ